MARSRAAPPVDLVGAPQSTGARLMRQNLVSRLEQSTESLFLLVAPSGFGKTDLLAQWARSGRADVAWFGCGYADAEPAHFWRRLVTTLTSQWPSFGSDTSLLLRRPSWQDADLVTALVHDLADAPSRAAIIVDDGQVMEPSQPTLVALAERLPGHQRLLLASQHNLVISTARLRVAGVVAELRASDLAFSQAEADELFRLADLELHPAARRRFHSLTQGWPAGLRMAALAMRGADDPQAVLDSFESSNSDVSDYLANEVIARLAPELGEFATKISVLEEFDFDLCRALTGRPDSDSLLSRIIADDLFISVVDHAQDRYRFHPLFASFLRARLKSLDADHFRGAHEQAMQLLKERGDMWGAVHHALAVDDVAAAGEFLTESFARNLEVGDPVEARAVARAWLARFGQATAVDHPQQLLEVVLTLTSFGVREAELWLRALDRAHPDPPPELAAVRHATWADFYLGRGDAHRALEYNRRAQQAVAAAATQEELYPRLAELPLQEAGIHLLTDDVVAADAALRNTSRVGHPLVDQFRVPVLRAWVSFLAGDLARARQSLARVGKAGAEQGAAPFGLGAIFENMLRGADLLEQQDLDHAAEALASAKAAVEMNGRPVIQSLVDLWLARLATAQHNHPAALAALADARLVLDAPSGSVAAQHALEEFRVAVALKPDSADQLLDRLPPTNEARLLYARLLVKRRLWGLAASTLGSVEPSTIRECVQRAVLLSLADQERNLSAAHDHLRAALSLAEPHGYVATILEQGTGISSLLESVPVEADLKGYVDRLAIAAQISLGRAHAKTIVIEGLSSRELTVLGMLSSRLTTHEIAETLFISPNTLKSHIKSIYRRLDVTSRAQAVTVGQARDLI